MSVEGNPVASCVCLDYNNPISAHTAHLRVQYIKMHRIFLCVDKGGDYVVCWRLPKKPAAHGTAVLVRTRMAIN